MGKWEIPKKEYRGENPKSVDDPKSFMLMRQIPSSSGERTEPISELLPSRELNCSLSSITLTAYNNNSLEELTKSKTSMTYNPQTKITQHKKQTNNNNKKPICAYTQKKTTHFQEKKINGYYQTISKQLQFCLRT